MSAPRRWLEEGGSATPLERDLLRSALSLEPPQDAQKAVWVAVLTQIPSLPPGGPPGGGAAAAGKAATAGKAAGKAIAASKASTTAVKTAALVKGGLAGAGIVKSALIGAGSAVALIATYSAVAPAPKDTPPSPPVAAAPAPTDVREARAQKRAPSWRADTQANTEPAPAEAPAPAPSAEPRAPEPSVPPGETPRAASQGGDRPFVAPLPAPAAAAPEGPGSAPATPETSLKEEANLVAEARSALRRGDASGAVRQLDQIGARIPGGGKLNQERESLMIEALAKSGRRAEASARAASFLRTYPASPFARIVQGFVVDDAPKPAAP